MRILSSSTMSGTDVKSPTGETLGDIEDLMIDLTTARPIGVEPGRGLAVCVGEAAGSDFPAAF